MDKTTLLVAQLLRFLSSNSVFLDGRLLHCLVARHKPPTLPEDTKISNHRFLVVVEGYLLFHSIGAWRTRTVCATPMASVFLQWLQNSQVSASMIT